MTHSLDGNSVFLTGGTGFLGKHLRTYFAERDLEVDILTRPGTAVETDSNERIVRGDVTRPDSFTVGDVEIIAHLAAQTSIETAIDDPQATWDVNATGTLSLLEKARELDIESFLLASTASVYGPPDILPITESHPMNPAEPYGASKAAADRLAHSYHQTYDVPVLTARIFNTFGPEQPSHNVVPTIIDQALSSDTIELGNLSPSRDFIYVSDVIDAFATLLTQGKPGEIYNVGRGEDVEVGKLAEEVIDILDEEIELVSRSGRQRDESVEIPRHVADSSKLKALGWSPSFDVHSGLKSTIEQERESR